MKPVELTVRQKALYEAVVERTSDERERLRLVRTLALRFGASTKDVTAVRDLLARAGS